MYSYYLFPCNNPIVGMSSILEKYPKLLSDVLDSYGVCVCRLHWFFKVASACL